MVEQRKLTFDEVDRLIAEAKDSEKSSLVALSKNSDIHPYDLFRRFAVSWDGLVIDGRPVYLAGVMNAGDRFELWTVVNTDVKEQIALFRAAKVGIKRFLEICPILYATMKKDWTLNRKWTERLGFEPFSETKDTITYIIKQEN